MKLNPEELSKRVERKGFESVWEESAQLLPKATRRLELAPSKHGASHQLSNIAYIQVDVAEPVSIGVRAEIAKA